MNRAPLSPKRKKFPASVYAGIIGKQNGLCACGCSEPLGTDPRGIHFDHDKPLWLGGEDTPENLRALKAKHHLAKTKGEAPTLAKLRRLIAKDGHRGRNLSRADSELARLLTVSNGVTE